MELVSRFFHGGDGSYFLFGPRGTGKSTLIQGLYPDALVIDLLEAEIYRTLRAFPSRLKDMILSEPKRKTIILDEVQKIPELLSIVHQLIELKKGYQFILTGSSARKLKRAGVDLLAGRAQLKHLHPFMAAEIKNNFDLTKSLKLGMLPLIYSSSDPSGDLKAYIALYMREEVQMEGFVRKLDEFSQFLEMISFSQASILNYSNIARDCHITSHTAERYIQILEDLLLSFRLPVFQKRAKRELIKSEKFYFFDAGVYQSIRPMGPLDSTHEISGHALETLIAQHLRAWLDYSNKEGKLFYWRARTGLEVDFIIYGQIGFYAIEVKSSSAIRPEDLQGLKTFSKDYPESIPILLYAGKTRIMSDNILCLPIDKFLLKLMPDQNLED